MRNLNWDSGKKTHCSRLQSVELWEMMEGPNLHHPRRCLRLRIDGWMNGQTDGWMNKWMDGQTDGRMDRQRDGWTDEWKDGQMDGQTDGWMDRRMDSWLSW